MSQTEVQAIEAETQTVFQLVYASRAAVPFDDDALEELLARARANNDALDVTGMLLFHDGSFIQALEGEQAVVEELYETIGEDPRHDDALLLHRGQVDERSFDEWTMGFHRIDPTGPRPDGLNGFLDNGVAGLDPEDGETIRRILVGFRQGRWHR